MLEPYIAAAGGFRGELLFQRDRAPGTLDAIEESLVRLRAARYELLVTPLTITLARDLLLTARFQEAGDLVDQAISRCNAMGELYAIPELLRIKANIVQRLGGDAGASEALLRDSIAMAGEQGARAWERLAGADLAALSGAAD